MLEKAFDEGAQRSTTLVASNQSIAEGRPGSLAARLFQSKEL
jgi:hypothetical protein